MFIWCSSDVWTKQKVQGRSATHIFKNVLTHINSNLPWQCHLCNILLTFNLLMLIHKKKKRNIHKSGQRYWVICNGIVWSLMYKNMFWDVELITHKKNKSCEDSTGKAKVVTSMQAMWYQVNNYMKYCSEL